MHNRAKPTDCIPIPPHLDGGEGMPSFERNFNAPLSDPAFRVPQGRDATRRVWIQSPMLSSYQATFEIRFIFCIDAT